MQEELQSLPQARHREILSFWHKIEFFIPYDLQRQVLEAKDAQWSELAKLTPQELWSAPVPQDRAETLSATHRSTNRTSTANWKDSPAAPASERASGESGCLMANLQGE